MAKIKKENNSFSGTVSYEASRKSQTLFGCLKKNRISEAEIDMEEE